MIRIGDQLSLGFRMGTPQQEHHGLFTIIQVTDHLIGEDFPALPLVGIGLTAADRQYSVHQ